MCLIALAIEQHPDYSLILCANRDEFHARPTKEAHYWEEDKSLFAGRDLEQGGTWLGVTAGGRLATVTNVRSPELKSKKSLSRGEIVTHFLNGHLNPMEYSEKMKEMNASYQGYNAIVGEGDEFVYFSNRVGTTVKLDAGFHTLSNASLNTSWPKTREVKKGLKKIVQQQESEEVLIERLLTLLRNETISPDEHLPNTGIDKELERTLSPIFINGDWYGTRASTIVLKRYDGKMTFIEQTYFPKAERGKKIIERIELDKMT